MMHGELQVWKNDQFALEIVLKWEITQNKALYCILEGGYPTLNIGSIRLSELYALGWRLCGAYTGPRTLKQ